MDKEFNEKFDVLLEKYTELMVGETNSALKDKIEKWALYTYISKSMPPLIKHWNHQYPEAKQEMVELIKEIKSLNEQLRESKS